MERNIESAIAFHQVIDFLEQGGLELNLSSIKLRGGLDRSIQNKKSLFGGKFIKATKRSMHFGNMIIARDLCDEDGVKYKNLYHQQLYGEKENSAYCQLILKDYAPKPTYSNFQKGLGFFGKVALVGVTTAVTYVTYTYISSDTGCNP